MKTANLHEKVVTVQVLYIDIEKNKLNDTKIHYETDTVESESREWNMRTACHQFSTCANYENEI